MTREEAKSCIGTIEMLRILAYNIHGVMDVIDANNCKKIIKALEQEPVLDKIFCIVHPLSIMSTPELEHKAIMQITEMLEPLCLPESEDTK